MGCVIPPQGNNDYEIQSPMPSMLHLFLNCLSMGSLDTSSQTHIPTIANIYWLPSKLEGKSYTWRTTNLNPKTWRSQVDIYWETLSPIASIHSATKFCAYYQGQRARSNELSYPTVNPGNYNNNWSDKIYLQAQWFLKYQGSNPWLPNYI